MPAFHTMTPNEIKRVAEQMSRDQQPALWEKIDVLTAQLAESLVRETQMRESLNAVKSRLDRNGMSGLQLPEYPLIAAALALPTDDTALKARLKAERERCADVAEDVSGGSGAATAIRNLGDE